MSIIIIAIIVIIKIIIITKPCSQYFVIVTKKENFHIKISHNLNFHEIFIYNNFHTFYIYNFNNQFKGLN